ncbi:hypothetical protein ABIC55_001387 [Sporosarcina psychrophila]|uniref:Uncharacterized protein n=1 Tax=Sporosarcina psychrophila TaxID=1476 RepID=A0ABV2K8F4_SPOPS
MGHLIQNTYNVVCQLNMKVRTIYFLFANYLFNIIAYLTTKLDKLVTRAILKIVLNTFILSFMHSNNE